MLQYLLAFQYDCVTFHLFVSGLRTTENAMKSAGWMLLDAAETLFLTARSRVYGPEDASKSKKLKTDGETPEKLFRFDVNPKWSALTEILSDIRKEIEDNKVGVHFLLPYLNLYRLNFVLTAVLQPLLKIIE